MPSPPRGPSSHGWPSPGKTALMSLPHFSEARRHSFASGKQNFLNSLSILRHTQKVRMRFVFGRRMAKIDMEKEQECVDSENL